MRASRWFGLLFALHGLGEPLLLAFAALDKHSLVPAAQPAQTCRVAGDELDSLAALMLGDVDAPEPASQEGGGHPMQQEEVLEEECPGCQGCVCHVRCREVR